MSDIKRGDIYYVESNYSVDMVAVIPKEKDISSFLMVIRLIDIMLTGDGAAWPMDIICYLLWSPISRVSEVIQGEDFR